MLFWARSGAALICVGALSACDGPAGGLGAAFFPKEPDFITAELAVGDIKDVVPAVGRIETAAAVDVGSEISGRVTELTANYNQRVNAGEVLARLDAQPFIAALAQADAELATARADRDHAAAQKEGLIRRMDRIQALEQTGAATSAEREDLSFEIKALTALLARAEAAVAIARARLDDARINLSRTEIKAPIDGFVLDRTVEVGQVLNAAQTTPILYRIIGDTSDLRIIAQVAENDIGRVKPGMEVRFTVDAFPYQEFYGETVQVRRSPQQKGRFVTYPVVITAQDEHQQLLPGMTASVEFINSEAYRVLRAPMAATYFFPKDYEFDPEIVAYANKRDPSIADLPESQQFAAFYGTELGIMIREGKRRMFFLEDGQLARRFVRIGAQDGEYVEVIGEGLDEGDEVVVGQTVPDYGG